MMCSYFLAAVSCSFIETAAAHERNYARCLQSADWTL